jgi:hypothetical protein
MAVIAEVTAGADRHPPKSILADNAAGSQADEARQLNPAAHRISPSCKPSVRIAW